MSQFYVQILRWLFSRFYHRPQCFKQTIYLYPAIKTQLLTKSTDATKFKSRTINSISLPSQILGRERAKRGINRIQLGPIQAQVINTP